MANVEPEKKPIDEANNSKGPIYDVGYKPWTFKMSNKAIF